MSTPPPQVDSATAMTQTKKYCTATATASRACSSLIKYTLLSHSSQPPHTNSRDLAGVPRCMLSLCVIYPHKYFPAL